MPENLNLSGFGDVEIGLMADGRSALMEFETNNAKMRVHLNEAMAVEIRDWLTKWIADA